MEEVSGRSEFTGASERRNVTTGGGQLARGFGEWCVKDDRWVACGSSGRGLEDDKERDGGYRGGEKGDSVHQLPPRIFRHFHLRFFPSKIKGALFDQNGKKSKRN